MELLYKKFHHREAFFTIFELLENGRKKFGTKLSENKNILREPGEG